MDMNLLKDVVDTHIHTAPDPFTLRKFTDIEVAKEAASFGAKAIVLKSHAVETAARAQLVDPMVGNTRVFGGITLNKWVGGLNPDAVAATLALGGKFVWLPTLSAVNDMSSKGKLGGIMCIDQNGEVVPELVDILEEIAEADAILATGHIYFGEILAVVAKAREVGVKKIVINHPELHRTRLSIERQKQLLEYGVIFERTFGSHAPIYQHMPIALKAIQELGPESTIIATDVGQNNNLDWSEAYCKFMEYLLDNGISKDAVKMMCSDNPAKVLGIE